VSGEPASIVVQRLVEWPDTDAAGHYHHSSRSAGWRQPEAMLHERLDLLELFGTVPRVRYEVDYLARLWFRDRVDVALSVESVGRTSLRYAFEVRRGSEVAARGAMVAVNSDPAAGGTAAWPPIARERLLTAGPQRPQQLVD